MRRLIAVSFLTLFFFGMANAETIYLKPEEALKLAFKGSKEVVLEKRILTPAQKDLAEKYRMAYPSMRSRVQRGRERLKQLFYNCCHIETDALGNVLSAQGKTDCEGPCKPCPND